MQLAICLFSFYFLSTFLLFFFFFCFYFSFIFSLLSFSNNIPKSTNQSALLLDPLKVVHMYLLKVGTTNWTYTVGEREREMRLEMLLRRLPSVVCAHTHNT